MNIIPHPIDLCNTKQQKEKNKYLGLDFFLFFAYNNDMEKKKGGWFMASEALAKIKETEIMAAQIIREAENEANIIIESALKEALEEKEAMINGARHTAEAELKKAEAEAQTACDPLVAESLAEIGRIQSPAPELLERAINMVIERIKDL